MLVSKKIKASEIKLVISGQGNQTIINESFYKGPSQIYVNDILREDCKYFCQLSDNKSNITIIFDEDITSCEKMFYGLDNLIEIDLSNFDNSKVTTMKSMFRECKNLININFGEINTSSVQDMSYLFEQCIHLKSIDLSNFDTSSVTNMNYMFSNCSQIKSIDASSFNTTKVQEMQDLFSYNRQMITVDVSSFDTSNTKNMKAVFYCCDHLKYLNLGNFDTSSMIRISHIFDHCISLKYLNIKYFNISRDDVSTFNEAFFWISNNVIYCIEDNYTKNKLIPDKISYCSDICFQNNIKFYMDHNICTQSCNESYYELKNECYMNNPDNSLSFYLDEDNIYRVCYNKCQNCSKSGNKTINNCDICKNGYSFLNDSLAYHNNCYKQCKYYYYFDKHKKYFCTKSSKCPLSYNKIIQEKNKCIDDCKNDGEYVYDYNNSCLKECPIKTYEEEKLCLDECYQNQFEYNNTCYNECPNGTYRLYQIRNICVDIIPENYYIDNNDNIYKECYSTCKKCKKSGNEINNNCEECIDNYIFINDFSATSNNCYEKCEYYYYFNKNEQYACTDSFFCPLSFDKLIEPKNKCIDDCKKDDEYIYDYNNKCLKECPENIKTYKEEKLCLDECYQNQFEYNNTCYNECPNGTYRLYQIRNICVDIIPENYYIDNNDNIYKECYSTCKKCKKSGNEINNNCEECIDNYIFLNDSLATSENCYNICDLYYYFDENNIYICTQSCPPQYSKIIEPKKKCIDDCKNDDEYIYEFNNTCLKECPEYNKIYYEEKKCLESCNTNHIEFERICYNNLTNVIHHLFQNGQIFANNDTNFEYIMNNILLSSYISEISNCLIIERPNDSMYQITNSKIEVQLLKNLSNNINNMSIIDLGECETLLKSHYHINENDSLIFIKNEYKTNKASEKKVNFDVYEPYNKTKLNLSICDETPIDLYLPMELSFGNKIVYQQMKEAGYDMFDINDPFYQDICTPFDSSHGTDILLSDRFDYIYNNDDTKCQSNCQFSKYSIESKYMICSCSFFQDINYNNIKYEKFNTKKIYESFYDVLKYSNYDIMRCFKILADIKTVISNIGSIITLLYFLCYIICMIFFIIKGLSPLKQMLKKIYDQIQENNNLDIKSNIEKISNPTHKNTTFKKLILRKDLKKRYLMKYKNKKIKLNLNNQITLNNSPNNDSKVKFELPIIKKEIEIDKMKKYSDYELNELEYEKAIKYDKRTFIQVYLAFLKREHLIIFTFANNNDYNLFPVKLSRCVFSIVGDMALNVFFFSDDSMHKLFLNYGKYDFIQQIPQITYSTIISQFIEIQPNLLF